MNIVYFMDQSIFHSRKEKEIFIKEIIQKLHISIPEKEMYSICIDVLEDSDFEIFFEKILSQFQSYSYINKGSHTLNFIW